DASSLEPGSRDALAIRLLLTQRAGTASATERSAAESALFERLARMRATGRPEVRAVLVEVARRLVEPDSSQGPEAWDAVAGGGVALGDLNRASRLEARAAARAEELGHPDEAARLRVRAGAYLYQAESYAEADVLLTRVFDNPRAGPARSAAGM